MCCQGLAPAWNAASSDLQGSLKLNEANVFGTARRFRVSRLLVVGQIALAVVVITAAGVMLRSLSRLSNTDPGFRTNRVVSAQISLDRNACAKPAACTSFYQNVLDRAQGLPGVTGRRWLMCCRLPASIPECLRRSRPSAQPPRARD